MDEVRVSGQEREGDAREVFTNPLTGESLVLLRSPKLTGGETLAAEVTLPAGWRQGHRLHPRQELIVQVLAGTLRAHVSGEERTLLAGETLAIPAGVGYQLVNPGDDETRAVKQFRPAYNTQAYLETLAALWRKGAAEPDLLQRAVLWRAYPETVSVPAVVAPVYLLLYLVGRLAGRPSYMSPYDS